MLIVFFTYFYTAIIFNPVDLAENLKKQGAFVPGVKPGARTAEYIDRILTRVTLPGSLYLAFIALIRSSSSTSGIQNFAFGGTSLLIVVGVGLDTVQQAQQHLLLRHYDGFMKKAGEDARPSALHVGGRGRKSGGERRLRPGGGASGVARRRQGNAGVRMGRALGWAHVSTGDLLRAALREGTALGREARGFMDAGELVPDDVFVDLVREHLEDWAPGEAWSSTLPPHRAQAEALDRVLEAQGRAVIGWCSWKPRTRCSSSASRAVAHRRRAGLQHSLRPPEGGRRLRRHRRAARSSRRRTAPARWRARLAVYRESTPR